jgi:hypothetical protein
MNERTFEIDGCTLTVRSATVGSRITRDVLIGSLAGRLSSRAYPVVIFADMVAQTTIQAGDLDGWLPPSINDPDDVIAESYDAFLHLPGHVYDIWLAALRGVDAPQPETLDDEKKVVSLTE